MSVVPQDFQSFHKGDVLKVLSVDFHYLEGEIKTGLLGEQLFGRLPDTTVITQAAARTPQQIPYQLQHGNVPC